MENYIGPLIQLASQLKERVSKLAILIDQTSIQEWMIMVLPLKDMDGLSAIEKHLIIVICPGASN